MKILKSDLLRFTRLVFKLRRSQIFEREVNWGDESRKVLEQLVDLELMRMGVDVEKGMTEKLHIEGYDKGGGIGIKPEKGTPN